MGVASHRSFPGGIYCLNEVEKLIRGEIEKDGLNIKYA